MTEIGEEKTQELKDAFNLFDKENEGVIKLCDVGTVMRALALTPTEAEISALIAEKDKDGNNQLDFEEFKVLVGPMLKDTDAEDEIRSAFKIFDKDGSGHLSAAELRTVMTSLGEVMSAEEVEEMIREADTDGDGVISYEEVITMMLQG